MAGSGALQDHGRCGRRRLLALAAGALWLSGAGLAPVSQAAPARPSLYVYLHTDAKSANLESSLKARLAALDVTVFGRFRDFEEAMATSKPDAVLGLQALLVSLEAPITLQGLRKGVPSEPYALVSSGSPLEGALAGKVVGVVDLLGRKGTQDFVAGLLKTSDLKLKRVTKLEDLLPLLQFSAADAVLMPAAEVKSVTERSRLPLRARELPEGRVGLASVSVLNPQHRDLVVKQVLSLDAETNRVLGVDKWRAP